MQRPAPTFTLGQMRDALGIAIAEEDEDALTISDMMEEWGYSRDFLRRRVEEALAAGKVERVYVRRMDKAGRSYVAEAYRPKQTEKGDNHGLSDVTDGS